MKFTIGVSMGSRLAPILANPFMGYHEKDWIENSQVVKPTFYKRYVEDIFAVFDSELDAETFYKYLNTKHKNIKFTFEKQIEDKLPFLDVLIGITKTYRLQFLIIKPTQDFYLVILVLFQILINMG